MSGKRADSRGAVFHKEAYSEQLILPQGKQESCTTESRNLMKLFTLLIALLVFMYGHEDSRH